ncbi:MAG: hypothetical protein KKA07_09565 [Bacteroidetes bacterium]|nr:hypothetical protein [Bacteroidota bacterium]
MKWVDGAENKTLVIDSSGYASVILVGTGDYALATSTTALPLNQWSNVAATYDGSNVCIFVNGGNKVCDPFSLNVWDSSGVLYFGYHPSRGGTYFPLNGMIDEMIWGTTVPTDAKILEIYNSGTSGMCAGTCGNGSIEWVEECDDGDTTSGDGCSGSCTVERSYECSGEPSVCTGYDCSSPPSDMISLWTGDNTTDDVKGVQNASLQGGATYDVGKVAQAFSVGPGGSSGSHIKALDNNALDLTGNGTLEAWIKLDTLPATGSASAIITKGDWDATSGLFYTFLIYHPSGSTYNLRLDLGNGSAYQALQHAFTLNTDTWYHVAATWTTSTLTLYLNGQLLDSVAANSYMPVANSYDVLIGADGPSSAPGYIFDGLIDEASIFNRALTQPEIQAIYDAGAGGICTAVCGNGLIEAPEACDDGDTDPGDGCSDSCTVEAGYSCVGEPSVCTPTGGCGGGLNEQCAQLVITGTKDIFYEGYGNAMPNITFNPLSATLSEQYTNANYAGVSPNWPNSAFIGVIDLEGSTTAWNLTVQGPTTLTGGDNTIYLSGDKLKAETTANKWTTLTLTDSNANNYPMTQDLSGPTDNKDIWYWIPSNASYSWTNGNITAPLNNTTGTNFTLPASYTDGIITSAQTILSKPSISVTGIFGTGITFALNITTPGSGTYTGNITYTLQ